MCEDAFKAADLWDHIQKEGYKFMDKRLAKHGINDISECYFFGRQCWQTVPWTHIKFEAFLSILDSSTRNKDKEKHVSLKKALISALQSSFVARNQEVLSHPVRKRAPRQKGERSSVSKSQVQKL